MWEQELVVGIEIKSNGMSIMHMVREERVRGCVRSTFMKFETRAPRSRNTHLLPLLSNTLNHSRFPCCLFLLHTLVRHIQRHLCVVDADKNTTMLCHYKCWMTNYDLGEVIKQVLIKTPFQRRFTWRKRCACVYVWYCDVKNFVPFHVRSFFFQVSFLSSSSCSSSSFYFVFAGRLNKR